MNNMARLGLALLLLALPHALPACTAFCVAAKGTVLFANNEDWIDPDTRMWFVPASNGSYGRVYFGFGNGFAQGGFNEKGLAFDGFAAERVEARNTGKPVYPVDHKRYPGGACDRLLAECATVEEVVRVFEKHEFGLERAMLIFADATGDAAVFEANAVVRKKGRFLVQTNFRQSMTKPAEIPCERFRIATAMLEAAGENIGVDQCRRVLSATHQEGQGATVYSNICDLKRRVMYLYHFHNFENAVEIDLARELAKGPRMVKIPSLFPKTHAAEVWAGRKR